MHVNTNAYTLTCLAIYIDMNIHGDSSMTETDLQTLMLVCLPACIHTYMHTYIQTDIHACLATYIHAYLHGKHECIHLWMSSYTLMYIQTY